MDQQQLKHSLRGKDRVEYYRNLLEQHERSGLSLRSFALQCGLSPLTLYTWRRRLSEVVAPARAGGGLVAVDVVRDPAGSDIEPAPGYEVILPDGIRVCVPPSFVAARLAEIITLLRAC